MSDVASALARHLTRPQFQDDIIARGILSKDQVDIFLEKAYKIWRLPFSKVRVRWGTWRKGIGGPADPPQRPKVEDIKLTNKHENFVTNHQIPGYSSPIKAEEKPDPSQLRGKAKKGASRPSRAIFTPCVSVSQSQPPVLPSTPRAKTGTSEVMTITSSNPGESSVLSDIDPEERMLMLRIPLELFYPPPPADHRSDGMFHWKCPIRGCSAVLDSASNYMDLFSGFSEVEAEWLRRKPGGCESEMGQEIIYNILCRHYEFHLEESGVDVVDVSLLHLSSSALH